MDKLHSDIWTKLLRFWPVIVAALLVLMAGVETRYQVQQLMNSREVDIKQWQLIRTHDGALARHETRLRGIEMHITPESIQKWGEVQRMVEEDHEDLKNHLRGHR